MVSLKAAIADELAMPPTTSTQAARRTDMSGTPGGWHGRLRRLFGGEFNMGIVFERANS
ncbi:hypothetical protein D3C72_1079560 [compost metagenome]